jgi:pyruvate formate lyase activating enzyme
LTGAARWWVAQGDKIRCEVCPRDCTLAAGQRGLCFVRQNVGGEMRLTTWGRSSGLCVDPIEKKPLAHFHPGTSVLSLGTAGCNLVCKFCQNWEMSKSRSMDTLATAADPEAIAAAALEYGCRSVAFTYNDPTIFIEYALEIADACHARGIETVAVTAGYIHAAPRRALYEVIDAANVDLKGFSEEFYRTITGGHLAPVLETLIYLAHETSVWLEVTTLLIPELNDSDAELHRQCAWFAEHLGADVPLHFSAFHPDFRMLDRPPTPPATLRRARRIAREYGLRYVYTGNVRDPEGETTWCSGCGTALVVRDRYDIVGYHLDPDGRCPACANAVPGRFDAQPGGFGGRRYRIRIGEGARGA